ncbi:MAG TPA: MaoC/PaaZ C-terminal domain-containing protein [Solirubrobacteraceae bacterium]|nr:MaoC/PaaZ C-terminal domain-containing protein [Solirubrobacteraceae bacterium]
MYLEDLEPGREFVSGGRTMTEADIVAFAGVSGDFSPLHTDEQWVRENTPFEGRIAHGLLVLSASSGLRTPGLDDLEVIAYLEEARSFVAPTYPGDTIRARWTVRELRRSASRPAMGVVTVDVEVVKQDGTVVQRGHDVWLVAARPQPPGAPQP